MKLIIQIPCYNEEDTLAETVSALPKSIENIDEIYTLIIDDGSTDRTTEVAQQIGIDYIVVNPRNMGLAKTFSNGIDACLHLGADIIVNTDGDNQYRGDCIPSLVSSIINKKCDMVVGCRDMIEHREFSPIKKFLQIFGSKVVSRLAKLDIPDVTSGFRAISRRSAIGMCLYSNFSYTLETLIQAGRNGLQVTCIPIEVNLKKRESRLAKSIFHFIAKQLKTIFSVYTFYCPTQFFAGISMLFLVIALFSIYRIGGYMWLVEPDIQKFKTGTGFLLAVSSIACIGSCACALFGFFVNRFRILLEQNRHMGRALLLHKKLPLEPILLYRAIKPGLWKSSKNSDADHEYVEEKYYA